MKSEIFDSKHTLPSEGKELFTFRELTRKSKQLTVDECVELLESETRGTLAVNGDSGYPYAMPMNHLYDGNDGCIYFHCGNGGHRLDSLLRSDKVSFCVCEQGVRREGEWAYTVRSVIVFGRVTVIDSLPEIIRVTTALCHKFTDDEDYIQREIDGSARATLLLKLTPEHICGKRVTES